MRCGATRCSGTGSAPPSGSPTARTKCCGRSGVPAGRPEKPAPEPAVPRLASPLLGRPAENEMRGIWSGHITFGLISIPVGIYAALESSERVSFRLLHRKDMAPIRYKKFCSEEDVEVDNDEIVKGYEVSKKKFAVIEKEELEEVQEEVGEGDRTIDVLQFVDFSSLNALSYD